MVGLFAFKACCLEVIFDPVVSFEACINTTVKLSHYHFVNLSKLPPILSHQDVEVLIKAFIISQQDNYNSLLAGFTVTSYKHFKLK